MVLVLAVVSLTPAGPKHHVVFPVYKLRYSDQPKAAYSSRNSHKRKCSNYPELNYKCGF